MIIACLSVPFPFVNMDDGGVPKVLPLLISAEGGLDAYPSALIHPPYRFSCELSQIWSSSKETDTVTRVQSVYEADGISHNTNTLGKGKNPIILPSS